MQDRAVVAAVVAGDADGFAAVYDQYATSLYACCRAALPEPEASAAVLDTFLIATVKLDGLRDPDRLGPWLHAVARNECLRRLGPAADHGGEPPEVPLPADLRGQVLRACADNSPAGRAHRMSVAHRAGVFGPAGFPKAIGSSGPWWWRQARRHPGVVAAAAAAAALAGATSAGSSTGPGTPAPGTSSSGTSPSPSPSPSSLPAQGYLLVAPGKLMLTSKSGTPASGSFLLTAANGPVSNYTVRVAAMPGRVTVALAGGSIPVDGRVEVTVRVTSKVGLTTHSSYSLATSPSRWSKRSSLRHRRRPRLSRRGTGRVRPGWVRWPLRRG